MTRRDGKQITTFDMSVATRDGLELFAKAQGRTFDELLNGIMGNHIKHVVKLKALKDHHNRLAQIAELREEQAKLQAEIADLERMQRDSPEGSKSP